MTPRTFGIISVVCGVVLSLLWGIWGGNLALVASLIGLVIVIGSAVALDDPDA